jgi:molybdopterin-guanine dinucleotide biosynthesis protein MobB
VVTLKNAPHKYYLEPEGKDTFTFLQSGSERVYLSAKNELLRMNLINGQDDVFAALEKEVTPENCDVLLLEGLGRDDIPMIEIFDSSKSDGLKFPIEQLTALVSDKTFTSGIPNFHIDDIAGIATFMENYYQS